MPRLRYRKDWTYEEDLHESAARSEPSDEENANEIRQVGEITETTNDSTTEYGGNSWLSNRTIIASLPDVKLRTALDYHRTMWRLLDEEIRIRHLTGRVAVPLYAPDMFGVGPEGRNTRRRTPASRGTKTRQRLTAEQLVQALQMLNKIREGK